MASLIVSISGVRGIVGEGLTPEVIVNFSQAFGTYVGRGQVIVGRDTRVSGEMLKNAVITGLLAVGCDVLDIGICPTPTTQIAVESRKAQGGIMITASHNPVMWNGLKLIGADGLFLDAEQGDAVLAIAEKQSFNFAGWNEMGVNVGFSKAIEEHINKILNLDYLNINQIRQQRFKIVFDCVRGAGSMLVPELLKRLGCEMVQLYCEPSGLFPHNPEPVPENLTELSKTVRKTGADLGIAVDPDSDRLALVSDRGQPLGEERTLALAVKFILGKNKGPVVINASTSRANEDIAAEVGVALYRTKVGEINVAKKMREINAVIGGEGNGGVILPDIHLGRDAPIGIALTLQHLTDFGGTISELNATLPNYVITKDKINLKDIEPQAALDTIRETYAGEKLDFTDGIKILRNKSWVHVRASNTEQIIRVIAEAPTEEEAVALCSELKSRVV